MYLLLLATAADNVLAVPVSFQDVTTWAPDSLKSFPQSIYDFLNPFYTPSVTEAIVACTLLVLLSAATAGPTVIRYPKQATRFQILLIRFQYTLYGLFSPDFFAIAAWYERIMEALPAAAYDKLFNKDAPKRYKWSAFHGAFVIHGGFVLWEDNKPTKTLSFNDIIRMSKSGEIELPSLSKKDIFARSTRAPGRIAVWFLALPHYWFLRKFFLVLPALTMFAVTHGMVSWYAYFWRSTTIVAVVEPIVLFRKAEKEKLTSDDVTGGTGEEVLQTSYNSEKAVGTISSELLSNGPALSEKTTAPDDNSEDVDGISVFCLVPIYVYASIFFVVTAATSPMRIQWKNISKQKLWVAVAFYIAGTVVTLLGWAGYYYPSKELPFPSEIERQIWRMSTLFLASQPLILLLVPRFIRVRIWGWVRNLIWIVYNLGYAATRISIFYVAFHSIKSAL